MVASSLQISNLNSLIRPASGPNVKPLDFPKARIEKGCRDDCFCYNPSTQRIDRIPNILRRDNQDNNVPQEVYWTRRKISETIMGHIEIAAVLTRNGRSTQFQQTNRLVAIKVSSLDRINRLHHTEDPIKEISAMQLLGRDHKNVMGCIEALCDETNVYMIMDYSAGGDLFEYVQNEHRGFEEVSGEPLSGLSEDTARILFRQMIQGIRHLHENGICHRDLSPENILVADDDNDIRCVVMDFGMALRMPYTDPNGLFPEAVTDVCHGTIPRLMTPQGTCGKFEYLSPEIYRNEVPFDGRASDVWMAGTILFYMLTGEKPYEIPDPVNYKFSWMILGNGGLRHVLQSHAVELSDEGLDLLGGMLTENFTNRLSVAQIESHPWLANTND